MFTHPSIRVQGRSFCAQELNDLQKLIDEHPDWSRHRVAKELCARWVWRTPLGQLKTFAARSMLLKLEQSYELRLPPVREACRRSPWGLPTALARLAVPPPASPIETALASLQPLQWRMAGYGSPERERALAYLRQYHYLGCNRPVGTHLVYLVQGACGQDLAVHLVGAAAWQCAARDGYIGWSAATRAAHLPRIANHSRFLLLPWVRVPHLASHLLGGLTRRVSLDWQKQHGWRLELLETFVETGRFTGAAYRAANWQPVGQTTGRTRQEKRHRPEAPPKKVWVYALHRRFRQHLGALGGKAGAR
jgi:Domain of unknown function (DUF4338)